MKYLIKYSCIFVLLLSLCGALWAQQKDSGRQGVSGEEKKRPGNSKLLKALPDGEQPFIKSLPPARRAVDLSTDIDQAQSRQSPPVSVAVWEMLEKLSVADRENARLELEVLNDLPEAVREDIADIEAQWEKGDFEQAIQNLRDLQESNAQLEIAVGISWKVPRKAGGPKLFANGADVEVTASPNNLIVSKVIVDSDNNRRDGTILVALQYIANGFDYWAVYWSRDGRSFEQTYQWGGTLSPINDISAVVLNGRFYVAYLVGASARMRRMFSSDGTVDGSYAARRLVFNQSVEALEVAIASNEDWSPPDPGLLHYVAILADNRIVYYTSLDNGPWEEGLDGSRKPGITNASRSLDVHANQPGPDETTILVVSYLSTDFRPRLHVALVVDANFWLDRDLDEVGIRDPASTSIAAFQDHIMVVFDPSSGIKYWTSDGENPPVPWEPGFVAQSSIFSGPYSGPHVAARRGGGFRVVYTEETGEPDIVWTRRRDYDIANWTAPEQINEIDVFTSLRTNVESLSENCGPFVHGVVWIGPSFGVGVRGAWFDKVEDDVDVLVQCLQCGDIPGGSAVTTDNFAISRQMQITQPPHESILYHDIELYPNPPDHPIKPTGAAGSNLVLDIGAPSVEITAPGLLTEFHGIDISAHFPPDPIMAAGPNQVMGCVNSQLAIFDKSGTPLKLINASQWYSNVLPNARPFDPQIVYDHHSGRWIMIWVNRIGNPPSASLLLSVSDDSNPLGTWCNSNIPGNQNGTIPNTFFNDYIKIGVDADAVYVTANMTDILTGDFQYVQLRIIPKAPLLSGCGSQIRWCDFYDLRDPDDLSAKVNTVVPAVTFGTPGSEYLINDSPYNPGNFMTLWRLTDPLGMESAALPPPSLSAINVPVARRNGVPPDAKQLNGEDLLRIDVGGNRVRNAVYQNGSLWTAHSVPDQTGTFACARYVRIDAASATAIEDNSLCADNYWYYYPAVQPDGNDNLVMAYTRSGIDNYAGAFYTGRLDTDPPGLAGSVRLKSGEAPYEIIDNNNTPDNPDDDRNRWGDYMGIALDPADNTRVWMFLEYADWPAGGSDRWSTWFGQVTFDAIVAVISLLEHGAGQAIAAFDGSGSVISAQLFRFSLTALGEDAVIGSSLTLGIATTGIVTGNFANLQLVQDTNNNGVIDTGENAVGTLENPLDISDGITFSSFTVPMGITGYIFRGDVNNLTVGDELTVSLPVGNITDVTGATSGQPITPTGSVSAMTHTEAPPLVFRVERSTGDVYAKGSFIGGGADIAERINVSEPVEPGGVVELDPTKPGHYRKARGSSHLLAGVITTKPGFTLGNRAEELEPATAIAAQSPLRLAAAGRPLLALMGRVPVKATTENGAIRPGDLLTVSSKPGYAMRCAEAKGCEGAIIGKALEALESGEGLILVLLMSH